MKLSVEILDLIFSFLVSRQTLIDCSKDPVLSQIVERHVYYSITVCFDNWGRGEHLDDNEFGPVRLSRVISENPRLFHYVRILRIRVHHDHFIHDLDIKKNLDQFAETLLMFPVLECIKLVTSNKRLCDWPDRFRNALEDRLNLPTLKELHIIGDQDFPSSLIDNHKNVENLLLSGSLVATERPFCDSTLPQLKSLTLLSSSFGSFLASVKPYINELRSLKCASSAVVDLPELLGVCSQTLNKLDIDFIHSYYSSSCVFQTGEVVTKHLPELSPVPPNLEQLTIRAGVVVEYSPDLQPKCRKSHLPAAAEIINLFAPSLRHLVLEIDIGLSIFPDLTNFDFSPLAVLGAAFLSIPRTDLYVHTDKLPAADTLAQFLSPFADCDDIMRSIKEGKLVVHSEETAPEYIKRPF